MGVSSSPDLSALDQYRTLVKPSVQYWSLGLKKSGANEKPMQLSLFTNARRAYFVP